MSGSHLKTLRNAIFGIIAPLAMFIVIGCSGSDGSTGATGPAGPAGPPGPVTATAESCATCHGAGKIADIAAAHPDPTGQDQTVSNITVTNRDGVPKVFFHVATAGAPVTDVTFSDVRFYIADMVPAGTLTQWGTWSTPYFERWAYEQSTTSGAVFTNIGGGNYAFEFVTGFGSAAALTNAPDYKPTDTQRLLIRVAGHKDADGKALTNNTVGFLDFGVPDTGKAATKLDSQRMFVTIAACKKCHGPQMAQAAHANSYLDTRACVICHSPLGVYGTEMQTDSAYLSVFIHKIHAAIAIPAFSEQIDGLGYAGVTYPQDVKNCVVCHTTSGMNLGTGNQINNWKTHPTAEACGSCHTNINFITGENHPGGVQPTNNYCTVCHPASGTGFGKNVPVAHNTAPTGVNVPEFDVTLRITEPANSSYYQAGETPVVTVTLKNHATGLAVDPAIYTVLKDKVGVTGGGLSVSGLYVYGPRAKAVPVLATGTITDPAFDAASGTPTQSHNLFVGGADPQVVTDSTGFRYRLLPIPEDMEAGTYMIRVRIADYGRVGTGDYHIESTAFINIQIGTVIAEKKVAGTACIDCHGTGTAPFHDERHAVVFNTDECLACHDQSGNLATALANRVHAVHDANSAGDIYNIDENGGLDWSDVTYPQDISRCVTCHNSNDVTYKTLPYMMPCAGCHINFITSAGTTSPDDPDLNHMRQNGGPF